MVKHEFVKMHNYRYYQRTSSLLVCISREIAVIVQLCCNMHIVICNCDDLTL